METNHEYQRLLKTCLSGRESSPRGMLIKEVLAYQSVVNMDMPLVTLPSRNVSSKFRLAEAAWILSGDNRVSTIAPFNKNISPYADDDHRYFGAYGPKVVDQLPYVVSKLVQDRDSRQAVISIWRENPPATKDVPCTLSLQFIIRNGCLNCVATMRSSDAWLGWPYDVFNFSMIARAVVIYMKQLGAEVVHLGRLYLTAGSQHVYEPHYDLAETTANASFISKAKYIYPVAAFDTVDEFVSQLWFDAKCHSTKSR